MNFCFQMQYSGRSKELFFLVMVTLLGEWVVSGINNLLILNRIYHWIQSTINWMYIPNAIPWYPQILNTFFYIFDVIAGCPAPSWWVASSGGHGTSSTSQVQSHRFYIGKWCQTSCLWPHSEPYDRLLIIGIISEGKIGFGCQWMTHGKCIQLILSYFVHFSQFVPQFGLFWTQLFGQITFQYMFCLIIYDSK
jgi:hypothetical protein